MQVRLRVTPPAAPWTRVQVDRNQHDRIAGQRRGIGVVSSRVVIERIYYIVQQLVQS